MKNEHLVWAAVALALGGYSLFYYFQGRRNFRLNIKMTPQRTAVQLHFGSTFLLLGIFAIVSALVDVVEFFAGY